MRSCTRSLMYPISVSKHYVHEENRKRKMSFAVISSYLTPVSKYAIHSAHEHGMLTGGWTLCATNEEAKVMRNKYNLLAELRISMCSVTSAATQTIDVADGVLAFRLAQSHTTDCTIGYALTGEWKPHTFMTHTPYKPTLVIRSIAEPVHVIRSIMEWLALHNISILNVVAPPMEPEASRITCAIINTLFVAIADSWK